MEGRRGSPSARRLACLRSSRAGHRSFFFRSNHSVVCSRVPRQGMELYKQQQSWLEREMASARAQGATHVLLFAHHPLFLVTDDEEEDSR